MKIRITSLQEALDPKLLGRIAKQIRQENGESLRNVARMLKFDPGWISRLENGKATWNGNMADKYAAMLDRWNKSAPGGAQDGGDRVP